MHLTHHQQPSPSIGALSDWAVRLRSAALLTIPHDQAQQPLTHHPDWAAENFRDDAGHCRDIDAPLLSWLTNTPLRVENAPHAHAEVRLWHELLRTENLDTAWINALLGPDPNGPLLPDTRQQCPHSLESATESELTALHALWALARRTGNLAWRGRALHAALWHTRELQPDNATNTPWAIHVFVTAAALCPHPADAAALSAHAQTLLHNALVNRARPDKRSALILLDAARELDIASPPTPTP